MKNLVARATWFPGFVNPWLRVLENKLVRNTVEFKVGGGIIVCWRKHTVRRLMKYNSCRIWGMIWVGHVARMVKKINARRDLMGCPKEYRTQVCMRGWLYNSS
jgi:hypothetical protein